MDAVATVLIADDSAFMRMFVRRILEKGGFTVVGEAGNGIECIERYRESRPEIVTLDVTMPKLDGLQTLKALIELDPDAKVVMVSALGQEGVIEEAILNGARDFIVKPFRENRVVSVLKNLLGPDAGSPAPVSDLIPEEPGMENAICSPRHGEVRQMKERYFKSVRALPDRQLEVIMETGTAIRFDFRGRLDTARFGMLRDEEMFRSVHTDGDYLIFCRAGRMPVKVSASEFMDLVLIDRRR